MYNNKKKNHPFLCYTMSVKDSEKTTETICSSDIDVLQRLGTTFCMQRPNVMSYGDLAIHKGLRMLYHYRNVDKKLFEKYRRRYTPHGTVASLYLWAIAGGAIAGMQDCAPKKKVEKK